MTRSRRGCAGRGWSAVLARGVNETSRKLRVLWTSRFLKTQPGVALHEVIFTLSYSY